MAVYFFSDVHLGAADKAGEEQKIAKLYSLLSKIKADGSKVFILGDLFDFWFEYKHAIPKEHLKIVFQLASLVEQGKEVHYISGNHDFWLGEFLSREAGIVIHRDFHEFTEEGKRIFMIHGDGLSPSDWGYRILKKILRNRFNIWLYRKIPPDWGIPLARFVSSSSRGYTAGREPAFVQDYENYAARKISEGFDIVLIGHLHLPISKEIGKGIYINTGDLIEHFSYARLNSGKISLEYL
ncbi:MAG: UDP-2,3-diacylglucosamine diphosphatase, partial [Candidatus Zixiibacteriota bacterium]|jgi:UDP-2,3-diacylglucosamine hydrolase